MAGASTLRKGLAVLALALLASAPALAQTEQYKYRAGPHNPWVGSAYAACEMWVADEAARQQRETRLVGVVGESTCKYEYMQTNGQWSQPGYGVVEYTMGNACEAGAFKNVLYKVGWGKFFEGNGGDVPVEGGGSVTLLPPIEEPPLEACIGGCEAFAGFTGRGPSYVDKATLSGGIVEIVQSVEYMTTGKSCGAPSPKVDLNGEPPEPDDDPGCTGPNCGTSPGGGKPGDPGPGTNPGEPPGGGGKPSGPGGGGGHTDPDTPDDNDTEPQCGFGDKPPCNTRIDETGTPRDGGERMGTERLNHDMTKLDNVLPKIFDKSDKNTSWGIVPQWFNSASCSPWQLGDMMGTALVINYCPAVPYAKGAASFMWIVGTFFAVLAMVFRAVGGGS